MRAAIYVRVSTQGQVETQTADQQLIRLKEYIATQNWLLEQNHIYRDEGYSGARLARPGLDNLRDHAVLFEFDVVVITAPDRLARNYVHQMLVMQELEQRGIQVEFLDRPMADTPHDRLLLQIRGAVAEYERVLINDRMRRGRLMKCRAGKLLPWSRAPYGYIVPPDAPRDPDHVQIDEAEAAIIIRMFDWYLEPGATLYQVAKRLTDLAILTPHGKERWSTSTVRNILTNTAYTGTTYANRYRMVEATHRHSPLKNKGKRGKVAVLRPEEEWIPIPVPAIVDDLVFQQVQEKLSKNRQTASRNNTRHSYLLRGMISCGLCRRGAGGRTSGDKYHYYVCRGHSDALQLPLEQRCTARFMPAQKLDDLVWADLCQVLTHPDIIAHALERAHGGAWLPQQLQTRQRTLTRAARQIEQQQKRLLDAYLVEIIDLPEFERKRTELDRKQKALKIEVAQLEKTAADQLELSVVATSITAFCQQIQPVLAQASFEQKRQLVELLIDRVIVLDEEVEIRYVIPTNPDGPHSPFCHLYTDYQSVRRRPQDHLSGFHPGAG